MIIMNWLMMFCCF